MSLATISVPNVDLDIKGLTNLSSLKLDDESEKDLKKKEDESKQHIKKLKDKEQELIKAQSEISTAFKNLKQNEKKSESKIEEL